MAGGNTTTTTSSSSGRAHFRSPSGCCICGTKSSSSRFTASQRYSEHFVQCFGPSAAARAGDLCNACVLCVKRWLQRDRRPHGLFAQVLDSKKGAGPKHMKEITKRARRREARQAGGAGASTKKSTTAKSEPVVGAVTTNLVSTTRHVSATSSLATIPPASSNPVSAPSGGTLPTANLVHRSTPSTNPDKHDTEHVIPSSFSSWQASIPLSDRRRTSSSAFTCCCWSSPRTGHCPMANARGACHISASPPEGATLTRAAAARKSEAAIVRALSCSTPVHHCAYSRELLHASTPSETSDYGSCSTVGTTPTTALTGSSTSTSNNNWSRGPEGRTCSLAVSHATCLCCCCCCCHCCCCAGSIVCPSQEAKSSLGARCLTGSGLSCDPHASDCEQCRVSSDSGPCKRTKYDNAAVEKRRTGLGDCASPQSTLGSNYCCCHGPCLRCVHYTCGSSCISPPAAAAVANNSALTPQYRSTTNSVTSLSLTEFRHPPPPQSSSSSSSAVHNNNNNRLLLEPGGSNTSSAATSLNASTSAANSARDSAIGNSGTCCSNNTPDEGSPPTGTPSASGMPATRRYNRRVVLPPVRMTQNAEVNLLLREIMERNSQAINFDPREMHMAVQKRLRSRNAHANSTSGSVSGRASSISSADDGSVDARCGSNVLSAPRTPDGPGGEDTEPTSRCPTHGIQCPRLHPYCDFCCCRQWPCHHHHHHHCHQHHGRLHSKATACAPSVTTRRT